MGQSGALIQLAVTAKMFIGEYHHNIDEKGRLHVPVKWRSRLAAGAVLTKGFDGSLKCYPLAGWQAIADRLAAVPQAQPEIRAYVRQTLAGAVDVELDKLGRMVIPPLLRQFASVQKQVVLAGLHDHFEVWNAERWDGYIAEVDITDPSFTEQLRAIGI